MDGNKNIINEESKETVSKELQPDGNIEINNDAVENITDGKEELISNSEIFEKLGIKEEDSKDIFDIKEEESEPDEDKFPSKIIVDGQEFESKSELDEYYKNKYIKKEEGKDEPITEERISKEKDNLISEASDKIEDLFQRFEPHLSYDREKATTEQARAFFIENIIKGNIKEIAKYMSGESASNLKDSYDKFSNDFNSKYNGYDEQLNNIKQTSSQKKWDEFVSTNGEDEQTKFILNELKNKFGKEDFIAVEPVVNELLNIFKNARNIDINKKILSEETENMKQKMMNTSPSKTQKSNKIELKPGFSQRMNKSQLRAALEQGLL